MVQILSSKLHSSIFFVGFSFIRQSEGGTKEKDLQILLRTNYEKWHQLQYWQ